MHCCPHKYYQRNWDGSVSLMYEACARLIWIEGSTQLDFLFQLIHNPHSGMEVTLSVENHECSIPEPKYHGTVCRILSEDHNKRYFRALDFAHCIGRIYCVCYTVAFPDTLRQRLEGRDVRFRYAKDHDFTSLHEWQNPSPLPTAIPRAVDSRPEEPH